MSLTAADLNNLQQKAITELTQSKINQQTYCQSSFEKAITTLLSTESIRLTAQNHPYSQQIYFPTAKVFPDYEKCKPHSNTLSYYNNGIRAYLCGPEAVVDWRPISQ